MAKRGNADTRTAPSNLRTTQLSEIISGFSRPEPSYVPALDVLVPMIGREYAAALTGAYLGRHFAPIQACSAGLTGYLASWVADQSLQPLAGAASTPVQGWDYAFGDAYRTLMNEAGDHAGVSASIAAHLGACGIRGAWKSSFERPMRLRWDDWLLPPATAVSVQADRGSAVVEYSGTDGDGLVSLTVLDGHWEAVGAERHRRVERHGVTFTVLVSDALTMRDYEDLTERAVATIPPAMFGAFDEALDIIAEYTPEYLPWVSRTIHQMFLLHPRPGKVESGSVEHYLGLVHLTAHPEPLPIAELLVHEATHQYMNVASKLQPLDDGTDSQVYWSPAVNMERPISKIVAAFHAFGNVMLFYRRCRDAGLANRGECERQEALLGGWMDHLIPPLVDNAALTPTGNALCQPLLRALRER